MSKRTVQEEMGQFLQVWGADEMVKFFEDVLPLCMLYNVDLDADDWVVEAVGKDDAQSVRIARTIYLLLKFSENHAAKLCSLKMQFKGLTKKMEETK